MMIRFLLVHLAMLCIVFAGCDAFFVGFVSNPNGTMSVVGTITIVQLGVIHDPTGLAITFTGVTFVSSGSAVTINFCGDERNHFPLNLVVQADFTTGVYCSPLLATTVATG